MNRAQELIDGLRRRAAECESLASARAISDWGNDETTVRCRAEAQAYAHSAELAQQILGTEPERDAEYWRMRCPVTEHDVTERGVTQEQAAAWMDANGFVREPEFNEPTWKSPHGFYGIFSCEESHSIAHLCNHAGKQVGKPAQRVLDEMAAITPEAKS
jgi:hypothetical protein